MSAAQDAATRVGLLSSTWTVLRKDVLIEWRTRARLNALIFFSIATLLLFSFALGPDTQILRRSAGGYLWLGILFASILSLGESFRIETENSSLDGLRLAPTDGRAIFLGKSLGNALMVFILSFVVLPVLIAVYDVRLTEGLGRMTLVIAMGCLAISAPGTVYASIAANARARDVLLPLLLFPVLIPALVGASKATTLVLEGDPMNQLGGWMSLLVVFNLIYWALGLVLFPKVIEE